MSLIAWWLDPISRLPLPIIYALCVILGFWLLQFFQRMKAAVINDRSAYYESDYKTVRRFGLGFGIGNRYVYVGQPGWLRIIGFDHQTQSYITDGMYRDARIMNEIFRKKERRKYIIFPTIKIVLYLVILRLLILPLPFEKILHPFDWENVKTISTLAMANCYMVLAHFIGPVANMWALVMIIAIGILLLVFFFGMAQSIWADLEKIFKVLWWELFYQLGAQWIEGAKVFDAPPGQRRPPKQSPDWRSRLRYLMPNFGWPRLRLPQLRWPRWQWPDWSRSSTNAGQQDNQNNPGTDNQRYDPANDIDDAYAHFGVTKDCTKIQIDEIYRQIAKKFNTDQQQNMPVAARRQSEEIFKTYNAAKTLIYKARRWK